MYAKWFHWRLHIKFIVVALVEHNAVKILFCIFLTCRMRVLVRLLVFVSRSECQFVIRQFDDVVNQYFLGIDTIFPSYRELQLSIEYPPRFIDDGTLIDTFRYTTSQNAHASLVAAIHWVWHHPIAV